MREERRLLPPARPQDGPAGRRDLSVRCLRLYGSTPAGPTIPPWGWHGRSARLGARSIRRPPRQCLLQPRQRSNISKTHVRDGLPRQFQKEHDHGNWGVLRKSIDDRAAV